MREFRFNISLAALFACIPIMLFSQTGLVNMNRAVDFELESDINQSDSNFHSRNKALYKFKFTQGKY